MASSIPGSDPHVDHPIEMLTTPGSHAGGDNNIAVIALILTIDWGVQLQNLTFATVCPTYRL